MANISAEAWCLADARSGRVLWGKHERQPRRVASITKVMTAHVAFRHMERHAPLARRYGGSLTDAYTGVGGRVARKVLRRARRAGLGAFARARATARTPGWRASYGALAARGLAPPRQGLGARPAALPRATPSPPAAARGTTASDRGPACNGQEM